MQPSVISHYNVQPVLDVLAGVQDADLWSVSTAGGARRRRGPPHAAARHVHHDPRPGRVDAHELHHAGLRACCSPIVLVYLLMAVNFQSWIDPLIILMALPGAIAGVLWMLLLTQTNISVPALMGAIMCIGVATSNSILLVTFANDQRREGMDSRRRRARRRRRRACVRC